MATFLLFLVLQFCDMLTTLVFLRHGVAEANPLVRLALGLSQNPTLPLLAVKAAGCVLAYRAWRSNRIRVLRRINWLFVICVAWNLAALAVRP